jgi:hypothetical protein
MVWSELAVNYPLLKENPQQMSQVLSHLIEYATLRKYQKRFDHIRRQSKLNLELHANDNNFDAQQR